jgi:hypothetical protein
MRAAVLQEDVLEIDPLGVVGAIDEEALLRLVTPVGSAGAARLVDEVSGEGCTGRGQSEEGAPGH